MQILFAALRQVIALLQQNPALANKLSDPWSRSPPLIRCITFGKPRLPVVDIEAPNGRQPERTMV